MSTYYVSGPKKIHYLQLSQKPYEMDVIPFFFFLQLSKIKPREIIQMVSSGNESQNRVYFTLKPMLLTTTYK